ncbi:hypothetical protein PPL_10269 [Heterostelium album PN500]|uniref:BAR domain-containing protein n=1 Tax=Heterostelium pallidum (strain ATCC 26659 / Pp 5 / PN500) TaxID=670386 RepID=D3BQT1_HETP5|nr:hypothetical protein PPL_10269 [Heterostelium album PN500]EFA76501.1 hypothetical protein PPL_10269 [Heterostelium album PN500]|eukprot:XP_020428633.1 hypothetical protein PPL_10269 [Heterostelium album PN500]
MKSFTKKLATVKQMGMEKMGKTESHADNDATKETKEKLRVIKTEYHEIYTTGKLYCQETEKSVQTGVQFADALTHFGGGFIGDAAVAEVLSRIGVQLKSVEQARQNCNNNSMTSLVTPVGKFQDTEIKKARDAKHKQDAIRLRYDTHLEKLADLKKKNDPNSLKVKTTEQECNDIKEEYDVVNREFAEIMEHLNAEMNKQLVAELREYALQQLSFYKQASALWAEADELLSNIN